MWGTRVPRREPGAGDGRYDDPLDIYPVVYAATGLLGAFLEKLQQFRPAARTGHDLRTIVDNDPVLKKTPPPGTIPKRWLRKLRVGHGRLHGAFVDVTKAATIGVLDREMRPALRRLHVRELDLSVVTSGRRDVTQEISRWVFERRTRANRAYDGIRYVSRFGNDEACWAVFDRAHVEEQPPKRFHLDNAALAEALRIHHLKLR